MLGFIGSFSNPTASLSSEGLDIYLHGYVSSRIMKLSSTSEGLPLTIAATHMDGIVLALTPNNHSYNYRSAILQGYATPLGEGEEEEKLWAMEQITDGVMAGRWAQTRVPPNKTEMKSTQILRVRVVSASAKIRKGEPHDDRVDLNDEELRAKTWTGVIPTWTTYGAPIPGADNRAAKVRIPASKVLEPKLIVKLDSRSRHRFREERELGRTKESAFRRC
jgi:nitroimidazol reductase NimA-like FMN-containing flavoprotein (pyridoxamine 5'-phosphate oxidase superfamily)